MLTLGTGGVAVVTGAAGGIGLGMARAAAKRGMSVVLVDVDEARVAEAAAGLTATGAHATARVVDVTDPDAMKQLATDVMAEFGRVDVVFLNAGIAAVSPITEMTVEDWLQVMDVDINSVFYGVRAFLPHMTDQGFGHLNSTASANAWRGDMFQASYNAAKHAVAALMESVVLDLRALEIPVGASVLSPGPIATGLMKRSISGEEADLEEGHEMLNQGLDPDKAGRLTLDAIAEGRFWIFTHPAIFKTIRARMEHALTDGALPPEIDWDWEELFATS
jgi:NAD(P)-dependent dehydrogenase (short-subunit alcohol dehydrogenase family)